ncbi:MaoC family dehydratase [Microbacterium sp. NPDC089698]|jgi:acyl dehydratase|uniref:MaoC family dehydratase n=1 Tax=unclassified Microbacterium TaxID=2609290 RepID=UPI002837276C|nr:MaoC family dehydratase [Microbacterium sp.]MDR2320824.1 MaoC family dehydratase [Microbacterium sp.]
MTAADVSVTVEDLPGLEGAEFGPSSWREVTQEEVDLYAVVSGDDNPIHVDEDFAATTPFGTRIAHGLLTLSLVVPLMRQVFEVSGASMGINYGMNRVRFPAPVPVGSRIRLRGRVAAVTDVGGGWQLEVPVTFEIEGVEKPACVAELVLRYYR